MSDIKFVDIDDEYLDHLRENGDERVPKKDYGENKVKPFFPLFVKGDITYCSTVTSPKHNHYKFNESLDFTKLHDTHGRLIGVVHTNYMFPVLSKYVTELSEEALYEKFGGKDNDENGYASRSVSRLNTYSKLIKDCEVREKAMLNYSKAEAGVLPKNRVGRTLDFLKLEDVLIDYEVTKAFPDKEYEIKKIQHLNYIKVDEQSYCLTYNGLNDIEELPSVHNQIQKTFEIDGNKAKIEYEK